MKTLKLLKKKARNSNLLEDWTRYKHAKSQTTNLITKTKRSSFREKIDENKGNPIGVWKVLKSLSETSKPRVRINVIVNILEQIGNNNDAGVDFENTYSWQTLFTQD